MKHKMPSTLIDVDNTVLDHAQFHLPARKSFNSSAVVFDVTLSMRSPKKGRSQHAGLLSIPINDGKRDTFFTRCLSGSYAAAFRKALRSHDRAILCGQEGLISDLFTSVDECQTLITLGSEGCRHDR